MKQSIIISCSILLVLIFKSSDIKAQVFSRVYFEETEWVSKSNDSSFFKADTVKLIKTVEDTYFVNGQGMNIPRYFNSDFVRLGFYKNNNLKLSTFKLREWLIGTFEGEYKWEFHRSNCSLDFFLNEILLFSFIIIPNSTRKIFIPSKYNDQPSIETIEISLLRKKGKGLFG